jgi:putative ABC transport system permease protein
MFGLFDSIGFALERLRQHLMLVFWALVGLTAATTLALSLPLYVDSVNTKLLTSRLSTPPYAFRFRYLGTQNGNIKQADVDASTNAIMNTFVGVIALPVDLKVEYIKGGPWTTRTTNNQALGTFSFGSLTGIDSRIRIVAGEWPPKTSDPNVYPVMISEKTFQTMGVGVGTKLSVTPPGQKAVTVQVVAIWAALNANDPTWILPPKAFDESLIIQPDNLWKVFNGIDKPVEEADWYINFNGLGLRTAEVSGLLDRITDGRRQVTAVLDNLRLDVSPEDKLRAFITDVNQLTEQLVVMILPVAGLVLYFVTLVAGLLVSRQQSEDVTLSSRGMSRRAIIFIHLMMWLILAGIALAIGILLAPSVVRLVGATTSFLRFDNTDAPLEILFTPQALAAGTITGLVAASSGLLIAWRTTGQTITSFKRASARAQAAWWQRIYLDIMLLVPAYYVLYSLNNKGGISTTADNPFADPLTFLGPTLFALGNTLLFLRIWPFVLRIGANLVAYGNGIPILMALRELTRSISRYRGALIMMCFTLSLTGFTASMASTIDRTLEDSINYKIGADSVLVTAADTNTSTGATDTTTGQATQNVTGFNTLPAIGLLDVKGVQAVARVGTYTGRLKVGGQTLDGTVMGVDRDSMAQVTRWRQDYATQPVADIFNLLASNRTGILVDTKTFNTNKLKIGQQVSYGVNVLNQWYDQNAQIIGILNYFPTLDPRGAKFFVITNIDPIWEMVGTELPNDIWMKLAPGTDPAAVENAASDKGYPIVEWRDPAVALHVALTAPARRGVLGFLSIGFVASILLTLVGNIIQSTASFRAQSVQLGSLRAMGLGSIAVAIYLIVSQGLAVAGGIFGGTLIGAGTTLLFLPLLDFGGGLPPYLVRVDWPSIIGVYVVFAGVLFSVTLFTTFMLGRERLFTVVKLGDAG